MILHLVILDGGACAARFVDKAEAIAFKDRWNARSAEQRARGDMVCLKHCIGSATTKPGVCDPKPLPTPKRKRKAQAK
jgi:hypothetical protein